MNKDLLEHYRQFGQFTDPGRYLDALLELPDDLPQLGYLIRKQMVHRLTLADGNTGSNADLRYGDMTKIPWWRQAEDDNFPTAAAILAELYRRDKRGITLNRSEENLLILTCRCVAILMASILKAKGIPARVRTGFAPYVLLKPDKSCGHLITQYWQNIDKRWVTIDADTCLEDISFNPFDMPTDSFIHPADAWLSVRAGKIDQERFWDLGGFDGLLAIACHLYYDLHCLMNNEVIYMHAPEHISHNKFQTLSQAELTKIDDLARLLQEPDKNFNALKNLWQTDRSIRLLKGGVI